MRPEVVRSLRCPVCRDSLSLADGPRGPLRCPRGHSFDQARQGYVQLTVTPLAHAGDGPAMVAARQEFLNAGHYAMITEALRRTKAEFEVREASNDNSMQAERLHAGENEGD